MWLIRQVLYSHWIISREAKIIIRKIVVSSLPALINYRELNCELTRSVGFFGGRVAC